MNKKVDTKNYKFVNSLLNIRNPRKIRLRNTMASIASIASIDLTAPNGACAATNEKESEHSTSDGADAATSVSDAATSVSDAPATRNKGSRPRFDMGSHPLTILLNPKEEDETKKEFLRLVKQQISGANFTNVTGFEEWFHKTLLPNIASDLGGDLGYVMIDMTFKSIEQFMLWVLTKFTK